MHISVIFQPRLVYMYTNIGHYINETKTKVRQPEIRVYVDIFTVRKLVV